MAHSTLYDRPLDYPVQTKRYPWAGTVAPECQLGGVLMGRFVACQRVCIHMGDFKESVAGVFWHAIQRQYSRRQVRNVWMRFLHNRWMASDPSIRELAAWFHEVWPRLVKQPAPEVARPKSEFLRTFAGATMTMERNRPSIPSMLSVPGLRPAVRWWGR